MENVHTVLELFFENLMIKPMINFLLGHKFKMLLGVPFGCLSFFLRTVLLTRVVTNDSSVGKGKT